MYLNVDIDDGDIVTMIEDTVEASVKLESKLMADREITKQFEGIQKELESCILRHVDERMAEIQTDIENKVEEDISDLDCRIDTLIDEKFDKALKQFVNNKMNDDLCEHVDDMVRKTVIDQLPHVKIVLTSPKTHDLYLESGEGREGKEIARAKYIQREIEDYDALTGGN